MNKFAEQFQNDVVTRYQEKMAELMEKKAIDAGNWFRAAHNRMNKIKSNQAYLNDAEIMAKGGLPAFMRSIGNLLPGLHAPEQLDSINGRVSKFLNEKLKGIPGDSRFTDIGKKELIGNELLSQARYKDNFPLQYELGAKFMPNILQGHRALRLNGVDINNRNKLDDMILHPDKYFS